MPAKKISLPPNLSHVKNLEDLECFYFFTGHREPKILVYDLGKGQDVWINVLRSKWVDPCQGRFHKETKTPPTFHVDEITQVLWYEEGGCSEVAQRWWVMVGRLKTGVYFHFAASCDDAGFEYEGGVNIEYSVNLEPFRSKMVPWES